MNIRHIHRFFQVLAFVVLALPLFGQQKLEFTRFYVEDGLSQNSIWAIEQDYQGFMWFGTFNGLNRYDGYSFKIYKSDPSNVHSINSSAIEVVFEDSKQNLWIGTSEGLNLYDRTKDQFIHFHPSPKNPNFGSAVKAIYEHKDGTIWVGGYQGVSSVDIANRKLIRLTPGFSAEENRKPVTSLVFDGDNNLWTATDDGLDLYDFQKKKFNTFYPGSGKPMGPIARSVYSLLIDITGTLWVAGGNGIHLYHKNASTLQATLPEITGQVFSLYQTSDGSILISNRSKLYLYNHQQKKIIAQYVKSEERTGLTDETVTSIFEDKNKNLWIGTFDGLNYSGDKLKFKNISSKTKGLTLKSPFVLSLYGDSENTLWVGTAKGIEIIDVSSDSIKHLTALHPALNKINSAVLSIISVGEGDILMTVWSEGTYRYNKKTKSLQKILDNIDSCSMPLAHQDHTGRIWIGCESGLFYLDSKTGKLMEEEKFGKFTINYLKQNQNSGLWLGYGLGIMHYDIVTGAVTQYVDNAKESTNLKVSRVYHVYEDKEGITWFGTIQGLRVLKNGEFESFWKEKGFPDHGVMGILEDDNNNLWVSANDGLYRFNKKTHSVVGFDMSDGLPGKEFSKGAALRMQNGIMAFGGTKGLTLFHPNRIRLDHALEDIVITDFKILNKSIGIDSVKLKNHILIANEINLDHKDTEFSFEFVAINFSSPDKVQYAYKLEGYDEDWNYSGARRFASYTNLPAGEEYVFKVKALNSDKVWSTHEAAIKVYITPPFWNRWWFRITMYAAIVGLAYVGYRLRFNALRKRSQQLLAQKHLLEEQVYQRTLELHKANVQLKEQAEEIATMNDMLKLDNQKLEDDVKDINEARVLQKWITLDELKKLYPDEESCYKFIEEQKWSNEYQCKKCGNQKYSPGHFEYSRRCSKCKYIETITANTIFEGIKFPIHKAFYLLFLINEGKRYTLKELADITDLRPQTCWTFKKRVIERTKNKNLQKNAGGLSELILLS